ncbi:polysaccharide export protein [Ciceribacter sp. L1K23]|uniref:polysaccharide biosynthesis/export family protein n=1 Tax=unclassified Ciceribacter TaxID=2628820 RepID=UPI001ABD9CFA|nr:MULTISPECIES: polysaccharide biosynthesis/export family protein [unclassified Ciceribacter]MBO3762230.1 polysaccharide export protein [Ciceribacter sp. L1K22]MBR0557922.1 polysaccharide export protein [Ciceribacter sp. L1K23]
MLVSKAHFSVAILAAALSGCTALPASGPAPRAIEGQAAVKLSSEGKKVGIDYVLIDINKSILSHFKSDVATSLQGGFGGGRGGPPGIPLGTGDTVEVSIFEAQAGGLFIPADAGSRPGNYITLPPQQIDSSGNISVPYAGRIAAAGRPKEQVEQEIEDLLANRAIEPQVVITVSSSRSSQVAVLGDVNSPQKVTVTSAGERVLDVISTAGGLSSPGVETNITLHRRGRTATISYEKLSKTPAENIFVAPGDTIFVDRERRTYLAFGASGTNGRYDFEESSLTLADALAKAGGLLDSRADPAQVALYRSVDRKTLQALGIDTSAFEGDSIPVIFRANLRDPSAFFAAQQFAMQDKDILYISNSDSVELTKFLSIVNSVSSTVSGVSSDAVTTRDAVRELTD